MPLRVRCPTGHKLIVPDDRAGRSLRCPRCGQVTEVPGERQEGADRGQRSEVGGQKSEVGGQRSEDREQRFRPAAAEGARRRDSSSVIDWPNSIAPPTSAVASTLDPGAVDQVLSGMVEMSPEPAAEPPPQPVVKPKSRALPPRSLAPPPVPAPPVTEPPPALPPPMAPPPPQKTVATLASIASALEAATPVASPVVEPPPLSPPIAEPPLPIKPPPAVSPRAELPPAATNSTPTAPPPVQLAEPEPPPIEEPAKPLVHPLAPERENRLAVYQLAAALAAAALFSVAPAVWDVVEYVQIPESQFVARWALVLLLLGGLQLAYAFYLVQLPDWTSVWVVTIYSLVLAAIYAGVLGLVLISREQGLVVNALQLADKLAGGKAILWCLCMVSLSTILAFFAGRLSARWHKKDLFLRSTGLRTAAGF